MLLQRSTIPRLINMDFPTLKIKIYILLNIP